MHSTRVALPAAFDPVFDVDEMRSATLVNVTNAELAPLCTMPIKMTAH